MTAAIAIDCEIIGTSPNGNGKVGRVSLVNEEGKCIFNKHVKPNKHDQPFNEVQQEVAKLIKNQILVGHSVDKKLRALGLCHPPWNVRDTALYPPYQTKRGTPSLSSLAQKYLGRAIQTGSRGSVQDAKTAMKLYKTSEEEWEEWLNQSESDSESENEGSEQSIDVLIEILKNLISNSN